MRWQPPGSGCWVFLRIVLRGKVWEAWRADRVVAEARETWRAEVDFSTRFVETVPSFDAAIDDPENKHGSGGGEMSVRKVLIGMIGEYARHMGQADLLRERIDGRIGQ